MSTFSHSISRYLILIWILNCMLVIFIAIRQVWIPYMNAVGEPTGNSVAPPFDGTIMPIAYIPDWTRIANQDKSKRFEDISISEFIPIPLYDIFSLLDSDSNHKASAILRYTYPVTYMGTYKLDYKENIGGHLGVDIRAPIGTPILAIANGIVTNTVNGDPTGNKYIVIRHDNVPYNGERKNLYSGYLHLSEILVKPGDIVKKGDMIGRVGISGITTTPHLHLQIDTQDAPFHPYWHFTSGEARAAGVGFYDAINIGLNKEKAQKYTIHPMLFINNFLGGVEENRISEIKNPPPSVPSKVVTSSASPLKPTKTIASYISNENECIGKRFSDVSDKSSFGNILYPLVDKKCIFQELNTFSTKDIITNREALINIMRYFDIPPANGTSHFLDIPIGDTLQGYALIAYRRGILEGNYAYPDHILTRDEVAHLITKIANIEKNPSQIKIYADVDTMNPHYQSIQDYAFLIRARGGKFYPKTLVTRGMLVQMLASIKAEEKN